MFLSINVDEHNLHSDLMRKELSILPFHTRGNGGSEHTVKNCKASEILCCLPANKLAVPGMLIEDVEFLGQR